MAGFGRFRLFLVLVLLAFPVAGHGASVEAMFDKWYAVQTNLQSWSASFTQTRALKVLTQPLVSTGKVWVAPGRFRWELGDPIRTLAVREPED